MLRLMPLGFDNWTTTWFPFCTVVLPGTWPLNQRAHASAYGVVKSHVAEPAFVATLLSVSAVRGTMSMGAPARPPMPTEPDAPVRSRNVTLTAVGRPFESFVTSSMGPLCTYDRLRSVRTRPPNSAR